MRIDVVGGPADGGYASAAGTPLRWIDALCNGSAKPQPGAGLYARRRGKWRFQGEECWRCDCGSVVVARVDRCPLCGRERR